MSTFTVESVEHTAKGYTVSFTTSDDTFEPGQEYDAEPVTVAASTDETVADPSTTSDGTDATKSDGDPA